MKVLLVVWFLLSAGAASALETTAGTDSVQSTNIGLAQKIDSSNAALTSVLNKFLTCANRDMIFKSSPGAEGKDADGCVSYPSPDLADYELYKEYKTVAVPGQCYKGGRFPTCSLSFNINTYVPDNAQDMVVGFRAGGKSGGGYAWSFSLPTPKSNIGNKSERVHQLDHDSFNNITYGVSNGKVSLSDYSCRIEQVAAGVHDITVQYAVMKLRKSGTN